MKECDCPHWNDYYMLQQQLEIANKKLNVVRDYLENVIESGNYTSSAIDVADRVFEIVGD